MKFLALAFLGLAVVASARHITLDDVIEHEERIGIGHITKVAIPLTEKLRKAEEEGQGISRIFGGSLANPGQFPYQAGQLVEYPNGTPLSGGVLINQRRVLTAAHNLFDGRIRANAVTVVLGAVTIFTGGTRIRSTSFVLHENYNVAAVRNDIAIINLPSNVGLSSVIQPIALPSGGQLNEQFVGETAVASGFGRTPSGVTANQRLSFVRMPVIANNVCRSMYSNLESSNICTSGAGGRTICSGDSGGPLAITRNNRPLLIGIASFGSWRGCEAHDPSVFARVTSFMSWIQRRL